MPQSEGPVALIGVTIGAFALVVAAVIVIVIQVRRASSTSASTKTKEGKKKEDTDMLQQLESLCPTKTCEEWLEDAQIEQDLSDGASSEFICSMCLDDVKKSDMMHVLSCRHVYHAPCLEQWFLGRHFLCPLCNRAFFQHPVPGPDNV